MTRTTMPSAVPDPVLALAFSYQLAVAVALAQVLGGSFAAGPVPLAA